jgi:1,2-dihydroxy-3-keto-5-methylthiopentene dioxygenase
MAILNIYKENQLTLSTNSSTEIEEALAKINVAYQRWQSLNCENMTEAEIAENFKTEINETLEKNNFSSFDIVSIRPDIKGLEALKEKFIAEHIHNDNEVRFFIDGEGLFCIHDNDYVYQILCQQGDYIAVPAQTKHWFDMGSKASFKCIRFFENPEGWVANYTQTKISQQYPLYDEFTKKNCSNIS